MFAAISLLIVRKKKFHLLHHLQQIETVNTENEQLKKISEGHENLKSSFRVQSERFANFLGKFTSSCENGKGEI